MGQDCCKDQDGLSGSNTPARAIAAPREWLPPNLSPKAPSPQGDVPASPVGRSDWILWNELDMRDEIEKLKVSAALLCPASLPSPIYPHHLFTSPDPKYKARTTVRIPRPSDDTIGCGNAESPSSSARPSLTVHRSLRRHSCLSSSEPCWIKALPNPLVPPP